LSLVHFLWRDTIALWSD